MTENGPVISEAKPENRLQKYMRGVLRWVLVALLAFGLGALLITFALYIPTRQKFDKSNTDLGHANATITSNTARIATLEAVNETLQADLDSATLHMQVLKALSGVRAASLAVAADDYAGARLSLIQASEALDTLSSLLGPEQDDVLTAMQQSADQALTKVKSDLKSAQQELDQLMQNLMQLENNLFSSP